MSGWLSTKDNPSTNGFYNIVFNDNGRKVVSSALFFNGEWIDFYCKLCTNKKILPNHNITHWKNLPEPPL